MGSIQTTKWFAGKCKSILMLNTLEVHKNSSCMLSSLQPNYQITNFLTRLCTGKVYLAPARIVSIENLSFLNLLEINSQSLKLLGFILVSLLVSSIFCPVGLPWCKPWKCSPSSNTSCAEGKLPASLPFEKTELCSLLHWWKSISAGVALEMQLYKWKCGSVSPGLPGKLSCPEPVLRGVE